MLMRWWEILQEGACPLKHILLLLQIHSSVCIPPDCTALECNYALHWIVLAGVWVNPLDDIGQSFDGSSSIGINIIIISSQVHGYVC